MTGLTRIYFDFMYNTFTYLFSCLLVQTTLKKKISAKVHILLLILRILWSLPQEVPYHTLLSIISGLLEFQLLCYPHVKKGIFLFIKFRLLLLITNFVVQFFHMLILFDFNLSLSNPYYSYCQTILCIAETYIFYALYIYGKRMKQINKTYRFVFSGIIIAITLVLSYLTLSICKNQELEAPTIPMLFSILFFLIIACIEIYRRFINILEENMQIQVQLEKSKLTAEYSEAINQRLKELHSLRHDMRNHFLTIDGYASMKQSDSIHQYISQITEKL